MVVDPATASPFATGANYGFVGCVSDALDLAVERDSKTRKAARPDGGTAGASRKPGLGAEKPIIFEAWDFPGMLQRIIEGAPLFSRVVVVGVCIERPIEPAQASNKRSSSASPSATLPLEFRDTLHMIAEPESRLRANDHRRRWPPRR
jgi:hypothetical protein